VTTVTFEERGGQTQVVVHDLYPSKEALDEAISSESTSLRAQPKVTTATLLFSDTTQD